MNALRSSGRRWAPQLEHSAPSSSLSSYSTLSTWPHSAHAAYHYPFINTRQLHHIDHVYPKSLLQMRKLVAAGCDPATVTKCLEYRERLANLQLLGGTLNVVKSDQPPKGWFEATYPGGAQLQEVLDRHDLGTLPMDATDFPRFFETRQETLRTRLTELLGAQLVVTEASAAPESV